MELTVAVGIACGLGFVLAGMSIVSLANRCSRLEAEIAFLVDAQTQAVANCNKLAIVVRDLARIAA